MPDSETGRVPSDAAANPEGMTPRSLDVFSPRDSIIDEYRRFATSFTTIHAEDIRRQIEHIYAKNRYWPEPLIQINPNFKQSTDVDRLVNEGVLEPLCADIFQKSGRPLSLYKHQEQAIALGAEGDSFVVLRRSEERTFGEYRTKCLILEIYEKMEDAIRSAEPYKSRLNPRPGAPREAVPHRTTGYPYANPPIASATRSPRTKGGSNSSGSHSTVG